MYLYTVWEKNGFGVHEKCLMNDDGNFIGQKTGKVYDKENYYASKQIKGKIVAVDSANNTGMLHLTADLSETGEENNKSIKSKFIGCTVTLEGAHYFGSFKVYRCLELNGEYFSDTEVQILEE